MLRVGLTGSIAVGKTFAAQVLVESGCPVLDADLTAREVVAPETIGWKLVVEAFGTQILQDDGAINRAKLGTIVFADAARRERLNQIVHPLVMTAQNEWLQAVEDSGARIAVIDAALMIESGGYKRFDKIVVAWCQDELQIERLMLRNNLDRATAAQRIAAQMPQVEKKRFADFLIDTSGSFADTRRRVAAVYQELLKLATDEHR